MFSINEFFLFIVSVYSLTFGFIHSPLLSPLKEFIRSKLPDRLKPGCDCFHCVGFWMSLVILILIFNVYSPKTLFLYALVGSAFSMVIQILIRKIDK